jgi:hypothetical protein
MFRGTGQIAVEERARPMAEGYAAMDKRRAIKASVKVSALGGAS